MKGSIRVVSRRHNGTKADADERLVSIDRSSPLGNPFFITPGYPREAVIADYDRHLMDDINRQGPLWREMNKIVERVWNGEKIALLCWCAPCACHGDIIKREVLASIARLEATLITNQTATKI